MSVFNKLQKHRQEYIRDALGYICDVPQFLEVALINLTSLGIFAET